MSIDVTLYSDPGCPWAYCASSSLATLRWRYGDQLRWRLVLIGLTEDTSQYLARGYTPQHQAARYQMFRTRFGMPFTSSPRERLVFTGRACRAIVSTRLAHPGRELAVLRALQFAWFCRPDVLADSDAGILQAIENVDGIDARSVVEAIDSDEVERAYQTDRAEARSAIGGAAHLQGKTASTDGPIRFTAPSVVFEGYGSRLEAGGFQSLDAYDVCIANLDPTLRRKPSPNGPLPLLQAFVEGLCTAEVTQLLTEGLDEPNSASETLAKLLSEDLVRRIPMGQDALWLPANIPDSENAVDYPSSTNVKEKTAERENRNTHGITHAAVREGPVHTATYDASEYRCRLKAHLLSLPMTPKHGALVTRTLGPRNELMSGEADVAEIVKELDAAAFVCDSPFICSLALLRCAIGELALQNTACTPAFIDASRASASEDPPFPFLPASHLDMLIETGKNVLLLVDCVHEYDARTVATVTELRKRWSNIRIAVSCDRGAGLILREEGFRVVPVVVSGLAEQSRSDVRSTGTCMDDEQLARLAVAAFRSDGNPLCCPASGPAAAELCQLDEVPATIMRVKDTLVMRDLDRYGDLFGQRLAETPTLWSSLTRFDAIFLAQPGVVRALDVAAARASELGVSDDWLSAQLEAVDPSSTMSVCNCAMIAGALIAGLGVRSFGVIERYGLRRVIQLLVNERDRVLRDAAADARLTSMLVPVASGLDRCEAGAGLQRRGKFIDDVAENLVTVQEFGLFLADNGYQDPQWWVEFPQFVSRWSQPRSWHKQNPRPTHPVTGVSWYEASAYANYLSAKEGLQVEVASTADRQRVCDGPFPWGPESPVPSRLNYDQQVGHTSPVGTYRLGLGPAGHADLSGNVWEWCSDTTGDESGVVCGGGWYTNATYVTSTYSYRFHRENRFDDLGFRLICRGPII